ncbi:hypothetical protein H4R35_002440 [Dimargaris xerosporica]|nr:hypothetical protein H4R35_002440 [Dimargaris xerosporica]
MSDSECTAAPAPAGKDLATEPIAGEPVAQLRPTHASPQRIDRALGFQNSVEHVQELELAVLSGEYPEGLNGQLFTVGPGTYSVDYSRQGEFGAETRTFSFGHWFDNLPLVNKVTFDNAAKVVRYRSRLTAHRLIEKIRENHGYMPRLPGGLYQTNTNQSIFARFMAPTKKKSKNPTKDICNGNIQADFTWPGEGQTLVCQSHTPLVQRLDPETLQPLKVSLWEEIDAGCTGSLTAPHSHYDPHTGETISLTMDIGYRSTEYTVFATRRNVADGPTCQMLANFPAKPSLIHSFAVTPHYVVVVAYPMTTAFSGFRFAWKSCLLDTFQYAPNDQTLIYVISRQEHKLVAIYQADPFFCLHHVNAFEDSDDNVYLDLVAYTDDSLLRHLTLDNLRNPLGSVQSPPSELRRYLLANVRAEAQKPLNMSGRSIYHPNAHFSKPAKSSVELPRINPFFQRRSYRYVYGIAFDSRHPAPAASFWNALGKVDLLREQDTQLWSEFGCFPGEPVFVPRGPIATSDKTVLADPIPTAAEDDGFIVSIVLDAVNAKSFVLVLNATTFDEVCRLALPSVVPLSFGHGSFAC